MIKKVRTRHAIVLLCWAFLIGILLFAMLKDSLAQDEQGNVAADPDEAALAQRPQEKKMNPLDIAIIGISFGGIFLVSSIHWLDSHKKSLDKEIMDASSFLKSTNCVDLSLTSAEDNEPMLDVMNEIQAAMANEITVLERAEEHGIRAVTSVEALLLRRLG